MTDLIRNTEARDAVMAKIEALALHDMSRGTKGRLPISLGIKGENGHIAVSIDQKGVIRFYDRVCADGSGILVHEEHDNEVMMNWLQAQSARLRA